MSELVLQNRNDLPGPPRWRRRIVIAGGIALLALSATHTTTTLTQFGNGRVYEVIWFGPQTTLVYNLKHDPKAVRSQLVLSYYSEMVGRELMLKEASGLAPQFFSIADSLGLSTVTLKPSWPMLTRSFPGLIWSYDARFARDSTGQWESAR